MVTYFKQAYLEIATFIFRALDTIKLEEIEKFVKTIEEIYRANKKILVVGVGRSGLVGRAFAMRLRHLGARSYACWRDHNALRRGGRLAGGYFGERLHADCCCGG